MLEIRELNWAKSGFSVDLALSAQQPEPVCAVHGKAEKPKPIEIAQALSYPTFYTPLR
jgi:hypothetical protein